MLPNVIMISVYFGYNQIKGQKLLTTYPYMQLTKNSQI